MIPDGATEMAVAMTLPSGARRGVMRALVETAWADARSRGISWAVTDWRTASLPTHRSWTALGYRPLFLRLHRHIDERIAWARLQAGAAGRLSCHSAATSVYTRADGFLGSVWKPKTPRSRRSCVTKRNDPARTWS